MNDKLVKIIFAVVGVGIVGAGVFLLLYPRPAAAPSRVNQQQSSGIANPASVNCITLGGMLSIEADSTGGQFGVCHLKDGRQCEEWALFRNGTCSTRPAQSSTTPAP